jgi:hypothetical protein
VVDGDVVDDGTSGDDETPKAVRHLLRDKFGGRPVYLPAFRAILEAATQARYSGYGGPRQSEPEFDRVWREEFRLGKGDEKTYVNHFQQERAKTIAGKTLYCREWFEPFVPVIRYPSLREVELELERELSAAVYKLAAGDRTTLNQVFIEVLRAVNIAPDAERPASHSIGQTIASMRETVSALDQVQPEFSEMYSTLSRLLTDTSRPAAHELAEPVLRVYQNALSGRLETQRRAFDDIRLFESSVNRFLQDKELSMHTGDYDVRLRRAHSPKFILLAGNDAEQRRRTGFGVLSSGERQVLTLLFTATHMSVSDGIVLVDEPELSLHLDWKRMILGEMKKQAGDRQIIACSHAPEVAAEHRDRLVELSAIPWTPLHSSIGVDCDVDGDIVDNLVDDD